MGPTFVHEVGVRGVQLFQDQIWGNFVLKLKGFLPSDKVVRTVRQYLVATAKLLQDITEHRLKWITETGKHRPARPIDPLRVLQIPLELLGSLPQRMKVHVRIFVLADRHERPRCSVVPLRLEKPDERTNAQRPLLRLAPAVQFGVPAQLVLQQKVEVNLLGKVFGVQISQGLQFCAGHWLQDVVVPLFVVVDHSPVKLRESLCSRPLISLQSLDNAG
uniref:(northern house mosquito) hypothetical protein n=1 Tax=Culex pipiens TaxID=7175 RepID=A0A8D8B2P8_CULPI